MAVFFCINFRSKNISPGKTLVNLGFIAVFPRFYKRERTKEKKKRN